MKPANNEVRKPAQQAPVQRVPSLAVQFSDRAVADLKEQRANLVSFIRSQLRKGVDFDRIPGTSKPTLLKPGSEKLANLFKLGSRIVAKERQLDLDKNFAMFTYTIEIFHIPTDKVISQCEGSANSKEKRFANKAPGDILNTLQKMAQKRAYVGAVIIAVGASDFFTHDVEDMDPSVLQDAPQHDPNKQYVFPFGQYKGQRPQDVPSDKLSSYLGYLKEIKDPGPMIKECISTLSLFLSENPVPQPGNH
jgi:hypothetical protein